MLYGLLEKKKKDAGKEGGEERQEQTYTRDS